MKTKIIFIHGLGGSALGSWGNFRSLIEGEVDLHDYDVNFYEYQTAIVPSWFRNYPGIETMAELFESYVDNNSNRGQRIIIIAHSMGGLIAKKYLINLAKKKSTARTIAVMFYAVPHHGANLADVAKQIKFYNQQISALCKKSEYRKELAKDWHQLSIQSKLLCSYAVGSDDIIVDEQSVTEGWRGAYTILQGKNHSTVIKPHDKYDVTYTTFKRFIHNVEERVTNKIDKLYNLSANKVDEHKKTKKYIPEVFVEIDDLKEMSRWLCCPTLFWDKFIKEYECKFDDEQADLFDKYANFSLSWKLPKEDVTISDGNINVCCATLRNKFNVNIENIKRLGVNSIDSLIARYQLNDEAKYYLSNKIYNFYPVWMIEKWEDYKCKIKLFDHNSMLITATAGQGKTNFVCDFIETVLRPRGIAHLMLNGSELYNSHTSICLMISNLIDSSFASETDFLNFSNDVLSTTGHPLIIIIDGLNECPDIPGLSSRLERFIDIIDGHPVKLIMTCRTEYLNSRFSTFTNGTSSSLVYHYKYVNFDRPEYAKRRLFDGYMKHFNIKIGRYSTRVYQALTEDTLLLRFFCESYSRSEYSIPVRNVFDLHREEIFNNYLNKKLEVLESATCSNGYHFSKTKLMQLLYKICSFMLSAMQFSDVNVLDLELLEGEMQFLNLILNEDIMLKLDHSNHNQHDLNIPADVINFTFDEFRDYLIAVYLINVLYPSDADNFIGLLKTICNTDSPVAEGVSKFLFYISKRSKDNTLMAIVGSQEWYPTIVMSECLILDDALIADTDVQIVQANIANPYYFRCILNGMMFRSTCECHNFNIMTIVNAISRFSDSEYLNTLRHSIVRERQSHYSTPTVEIDHFVELLDFVYEECCDKTGLALLLIIVYSSNPYICTSLKRYVKSILDHTLPELPLVLVNYFSSIASNELRNDLVASSFDRDNRTVNVLGLGEWENITALSGLRDEVREATFRLLVP